MDNSISHLTMGLVIPDADGLFETRTLPVSEAVGGRQAPIDLARLIGRWAGDDGLGMAMFIDRAPGGERNFMGERIFSAFWGNDPSTVTADDPGVPLVIYGAVGFLGLDKGGAVSFDEGHAATLAPMMEKRRQDVVLSRVEQDLLDTEIAELEALL